MLSCLVILKKLLHLKVGDLKFKKYKTSNAIYTKTLCIITFVLNFRHPGYLVNKRNLH